MRTFAISLFCILAFYAYGLNSETKNSTTNISSNTVPGNTSETAAAAPELSATPKVGPKEPKTVRDFFNLLPEKYFQLEGCDPETDKGCRKARAEYLKTFTEVEDIGNGYFKGGCDGGQSCIEMAIFKRLNSTYLIGVHVSHELIEKNYFLDYDGVNWTDVSVSVVPEFSKKNLYELPRVGTTVKVFAKKITEQGDDYEVSEKGSKLYDLVWKDGKFTKQK